MGRVKPLTDTQCKGFKPKDKEYKVADGDGLYLHIKPTGSKLWRLRVTINGKQTTKSLGAYPAMSLKDVRLKRDGIKSSLANGINPFMKKVEVLTFRGLASEYLKHRDDLSETYARKQGIILERNFYPLFGNVQVDGIEASHLIEALKRMSDRGVTVLARKGGALLDRIFRYGVTLQYIKYNPMRDIDMNVLLKSHKVKNFSHITDPKEFGELLRLIDDYSGDHSTRVALMLAPYVFVRPANIRMAEWSEFDFEAKTWTIPADKMKMNRDHVVPLTDKMIEIIKLNADNGSKYLFPSAWSTSKPLSENTLNVALKRMGYAGIMTSHGFRHTASTMLHETSHIHGVSSDVIEVQMAHVDASVRGVYNKALYIEERVKLMEWWSGRVDEMREMR